jgi:hypothetical protein
MRYLIILGLLFTLNSSSQCKEFIIGAKGDTLNCVDMSSRKQGPWVIRIDELRGERGYEEEGYFQDDKKEGTWRRFSLEGDLVAIENYSYGMKNGKCSYYTNTGALLREENWRAIDPKNPFDTVDVRDVNDPSKILRKVIVKVEPNSYRHGTWTYYNTMTGGIESTEQWVMNRPKAEVEPKPEQGDDLAPIDVKDNTTKTAEKKTSAKPKEVMEFEKKNSGKKKVKVRDGRTGG